MQLKQTDTVRCRYGENVEELWGDWEVLFEKSEVDYQGGAEFLVKKDNSYVYYEYFYGSCSVCDDWEARNLNDREIKKEMRDEAIILRDIGELNDWYAMLLESGRKDELTSVLSKYLKKYKAAVTKRKEYEKTTEGRINKDVKRIVKM